MTKGYKFIEDLTSDVMFEARGKDLKEVFTNSAEALFSVICQKGKIGDGIKKEMVVEGDDVRDLLVNWLQELIARVDIEGLFFSRFDITSISKTRLKAVVYGEEADPRKGGTVVKAVTYYKLSIEETESGWKARVALDI